MQRQTILHWRFTGCGRVSGLHVSGRLFPLHPLPRPAELPRPPGSGQVPKGDAQQFGVSSSQFQAAERACQHLYPGNGGSFQQSIQQCELTGDCPQAVVQQALTEMRNYARCIRSHGVPNWPDPTTDSQGRPYFDVSRAGISHAYTHSPLFESKDRICERQVGGSAGVPVPMG
jgi:hypothetical protein